MDHRRILYISPNAFRGGAEKFVLDNLLLHKKSGLFEAEVLFFSDGPVLQELKSEGIRVHLLPFKLKMSRPWTVVRAMLYLFLLLKSEKISIVHSTMAYAHIIASIPSVLAGVPEIWFQHGPVGNLWDHLGKLLPFRKLLFNSVFLKNEHEKLFGPNFDEDSLVLPLGVEINKGTDLKRESFQIKNDQRLLLWVGRICTGKGLHLAIEALSHLRDRTDWHFMVIGNANSKEDQLYLEKIKQRIMTLKLKMRVSFVHDQKEMSQFYNISDFLIHSAVIPESFGLVVAEALGHGLFVAASCHGGVSTLIGENQRGILYDSFSKSASLTLAGIIEEYLEGRTFEVEKMRNEAVEFIEKLHSPAQMNSQLELLYQRVLN